MTEEARAPRNKAERLAVAGAIAPSLREGSERARRRRVAVVNADGEIVRYTTLAEVQRALLERQQIEIETGEGVRPKEIMCGRCGRTEKVSARGGVPLVCSRCRNVKCSDCKLPLNPTALWRGNVRCTECHARARTIPPATCVDCRKDLSASGRRRAAKRCVRCNARHRTKPRPSCCFCGVSLRRSNRAVHQCQPCFLARQNKRNARIARHCADCGTALAKTSRKGTVRCKRCAAVATYRRKKAAS